MNITPISLTGEDANYTPVNGLPAQGPADTALVNMNEVVQHHLLSRRTQLEAMQVIIRFDALPHVSGSREDVSALFSHVFNSILESPPTGTKLFIYIRCEKEKSEVMDLTLPEGFQQHCILVYTNIVADKTWQLAQQPVLADMQYRTARLNGSFEHYSITKTGCLFQWVLPGKLL